MASRQHPEARGAARRRPCDRLLLALLLAACALLTARPALAHTLPVNTLVNVFVRVQGTQVDLLARVPMDLLRGVPFPQRDGRYELAGAQAGVELALVLLADAFVLQADGEPLATRFSEGRIAASDDRPFDKVEHALQATAQATDRAARIAVDTGFLDLHYRYALPSPQARLAFQSHVLVDAGVLAPVTLRLQRDGQTGAALMLRDATQAVELEPRWQRAAASFAALGVEHLLSGYDHLLFLPVLALVRRHGGERWLMLTLSAAAGVAGMAWLAERGQALWTVSLCGADCAAAGASPWIGTGLALLVPAAAAGLRARLHAGAGS